MITERDMAIVNWLNGVGYARTSHVAAVHFHGLRQSALVARRRLRRLLELALVRRFSDARLGEYVWHTQARERGQKYQHGLLVAGVHAAVARHPALYWHNYVPAYRRQTGSGYGFEADAFLACLGRNRAGQDMGTLAFIECDNAENLRDWDAWRRYEDYLLTGDWRAEPWWERFKVFPRVVFVGRADRLQAMRARLAGSGTRLSLGWLDVNDMIQGNLAALGWPLRKGASTNA